MVEIWLVRHGETDWNKAHRWQGQTDVPLNEAGLEQTRRLARRLHGHTFDLVYASDLGRARVTAEVVCPGTPLRLDPRLREMDFGSLEGRTWDNLTSDEQARLELWGQDPYHGRLDDRAESFSELESRLLEWRAELPPSGRVAAFTHGGPIRCLLWHLFGPPRGRAWSISLDNAGITRLAFHGLHTSVLSVNDCAHLEPPFRA